MTSLGFETIATGTVASRGKPVSIEQLRTLERWCAWTRKPVNGQSKRPPRGAHGKELKATSQIGWCSFDQLPHREHIGRDDGFGLLMGPAGDGGGCIAYIDLDGVVPLVGHDLLPGHDCVSKLLDRFPGTLVERSPSGTGLHVYFLVDGITSFDVVKEWIGSPKIILGGDHHEIEIHFTDAYATFSGRDPERWGDRPPVLARFKLPETVAAWKELRENAAGRSKAAEAGIEDEEEDSETGPITVAEIEARASRWCPHKLLPKMVSGEWTGTAAGSDDSGSGQLAAWMRGCAQFGFGLDRIKTTASACPDWLPEAVARVIQKDRAEANRQVDRLWSKAPTNPDRKGSCSIEEEWERARERRAKRLDRTVPIEDLQVASGMAEDGVAREFEEVHADNLRYDTDKGTWFRYSGKLWERRSGNLGFQAARLAARELAEKSDKARDRIVLGKAAFAGAVETFVKSGPLSCFSSIWDRDPWLLGTPDGTVELRTGQLREPRAGDFITKATSVVPAATPDCPKWLRFLEEVTCGDPELAHYLRLKMGYTVTGDTSEECLTFLHGEGRNGKSKMLAVLVEIMGSYCATASMETFTMSRHDRHPTELAMLAGARMVMASETEEGRTWAEQRIKSMTGGDPITAHFMRKDNFTFTPSFKLWIAGNHQPRLKNVDLAMRRRLKLVPFNLVLDPAEVNRNLLDELRPEFPSILRWMIDGCLEWQRNGLPEPRIVAEASEQYFSSQDVVGQFLDDCAEIGANMGVQSAQLWDRWTKWADDNGQDKFDNRWLTAQLQRRNFRQVKNHALTDRKRGFLGLRLRPEPY